MITLMEILILLIIYFLVFNEKDNHNKKIKVLIFFILYIIIRFTLTFILDNILDLKMRRYTYYVLALLLNSLIFTELEIKATKYYNKEYSFLPSVYLICENLLSQINHEIKEIPINNKNYLFCKGIFIKLDNIEKQLEFMSEFYITLTAELLLKKGIQLNKEPHVTLEKDFKNYIISFEGYPKLNLILDLSKADNFISIFSITIIDKPY